MPVIIQKQPAETGLGHKAACIPLLPAAFYAPKLQMSFENRSTDQSPLFSLFPLFLIFLYFPDFFYFPYFLSFPYFLYILLFPLFS